MDYKSGKWASEILALQREDGIWGLQFHTLSVPTKKYPLTTEQALRRLRILGYDLHDAPIRKTVDYMTACLRGECKMDDSWERLHDWPLFTKLMLSTWVRLFEPENEVAVAFARRWAAVMENAFAGGAFDRDAYVQAYIDEFGAKHHNVEDFDKYYMVPLLRGLLKPETESLWLEHVLTRPGGIYYIMNKPLDKLPEVFASREASLYLAALEAVAEYDSARGKLGYAVDWLNNNRDEDGQWDFGAKASDGVYFPLSNSWRAAEVRRADCTGRVERFLRRVTT